MKTQRYQDENGIALILTLTILAVVMILLMSFIVSMRTERMAARASSDLSRAKSLAEGAVNEAVGLLQASTTNITANTSYITAPGVVYTRNNGTWNTTLLYTPGVALDLNLTNGITGTGSFYPSGGAPIKVGWQKVFSAAPGQQLVGQFAYWVDDESTKVNLNTAHSPKTDIAGYTPAAIDLGAIFSSTDAGNISTFASAIPLDSIETVKMANSTTPPGPGVSPSAFSNNEFFITTGSTTPDLTPWGTKRLNLNSLLPSASNPTLAQKQSAVTKIAAALSDPQITAWFGQDFTGKYSQPNQLQQIAANIVDYIGKDNTPTDSSSNPNDTSAPTYLGLKQTPYINELVISNTFILAADAPPATTGTLTINTSITVELWYMYTNAVWQAPLGTTILLQNLPNLSLAGVTGGPTVPLSSTGSLSFSLGFNHMNPNPSANDANTYATVTTVLPPQTFPVPDVTQGVTARLLPTAGPGVTAILRSLVGRMDYAQIKLPLATMFGSLKQSGLTTVSLVWQAECNDPRVKPVNNIWKQIPTGQANTLMAPNTAIDTVNGNGTGTLFGDSILFNGNPGITPDISCHVVSGSRQRGSMYPSELAYIHTGVPWRTFSLEPQQSKEGATVPDWLAVDLFSGTDSPNPAGLMNINVLDGNSSDPSRLQPLAALFSGNSAIATATGNIYSATLNTTPTMTQFATAADGARAAFTTAGQVCETATLASSSGTKSDRELPVLQVVNLVTPRSDTFTVWAIAQSIQKVDKTQPLTLLQKFGDLITGEVKIQAVVQRYEDASTSPSRVRYRTLYYRYIYE